jgi:REP-associated tyrosine transposase
MRKERQLELPFRSRLRKRRPRRSTAASHRCRPAHCHRHPVHITLRRALLLPSLRRPAVFESLRRALGRTARAWFRVIHFSLQDDHAHLIVEAADKASLSRGMMGLTVRLARAFNRVLGLRGSVWSDRFHGRALRTPREMRNCLVYVLFNHRKHSVHREAAQALDACSSAPWFNGWKQPAVGPPAVRDGPVIAPRTWLARVGWMRHGLLDRSEAPKRTERAG